MESKSLLIVSTLKISYIMPVLIKTHEKSDNNVDDLGSSINTQQETISTLLSPHNVGLCVCVFDWGACSV